MDFLQNTPKRLTLLTSVKLFAQANRAACVKRVKDMKHECKGQKNYQYSLWNLNEIYTCLEIMLLI